MRAHISESIFVYESFATLLLYLFPEKLQSLSHSGGSLDVLLIHFGSGHGIKIDASMCSNPGLTELWLGGIRRACEAVCSTKVVAWTDRAQPESGVNSQADAVSCFNTFNTQHLRNIPDSSNPIRVSIHVFRFVSIAKFQKQTDCSGAHVSEGHLKRASQ